MWTWFYRYPRKHNLLLGVKRAIYLLFVFFKLYNIFTIEWIDTWMPGCKMSVVVHFKWYNKVAYTVIICDFEQAQTQRMPWENWKFSYAFKRITYYIHTHEIHSRAITCCVLHCATQTNTEYGTAESYLLCYCCCCFGGFRCCCYSKS